MRSGEARSNGCGQTTMSKDVVIGWGYSEQTITANFRFEGRWLYIHKKSKPPKHHTCYSTYIVNPIGTLVIIAIMPKIVMIIIMTVTCSNYGE